MASSFSRSLTRLPSAVASGPFIRDARVRFWLVALTCVFVASIPSRLIASDFSNSYDAWISHVLTHGDFTTVELSGPEADRLKDMGPNIIPEILDKIRSVAPASSEEDIHVQFALQAMLQAVGSIDLDEAFAPGTSRTEIGANRERVKSWGADHFMKEAGDYPQLWHEYKDFSPPESGTPLTLRRSLFSHPLREIRSDGVFAIPWALKMAFAENASEPFALYLFVSKQSADYDQFVATAGRSVASKEEKRLHADRWWRTSSGKYTELVTLHRELTNALEAPPFAAYVYHSALVLNNATILGDIAAKERMFGPYVSETQAEIVIGNHCRVDGTVFGDTVQIGEATHVSGSVASNEPTLGQASVVLKPGEVDCVLPILDPIQALTVINPGDMDVILADGETRTLVAGAYGRLRLGKNSSLRIPSGAYHFRSAEIQSKAAIEFGGPTVLLIKERMSLSAGSAIQPAPDIEPPTARLEIVLEGINGAEGSITAEPKTVDLENQVTVSARIAAPNGTVRCGNQVTIKGSIVAKWIHAGNSLWLLRE